LDFDDLVLSPPTLTVSNPAPLVAPCVTDTFTLRSSSSAGLAMPLVPPVICGVLSGNHSKLLIYRTCIINISDLLPPTRKKVAKCKNTVKNTEILEMARSKRHFDCNMLIVN
jgi:hypothetical protein